MTSPFDSNTSNEEHNSANTAGTPNQQRTSNRMSMPSAREMLEKESRTYSSNRGTGSWGSESPSEQRNRAEAAKQLEDYDFMAPFRKPGVPEYRVRTQDQTPTRRYADTSSSHYSGKRESVNQSARPSVRKQTGTRPSVRREQNKEQAKASSQQGGLRSFVRQTVSSESTPNKRPSARRQDERQAASQHDSQTYRDRATSRFSAEEVSKGAQNVKDYSLRSTDGGPTKASSRYSRNDQQAHSRYRELGEPQEERAAGMQGLVQGAAHAARTATEKTRFIPMGTPGSAPKNHGPQPFATARKAVFGAVALVAVVALGVFGFQNWDANRPVHIMLNDQEVSVEGSQRSVEGLLDAGTVSVNSGNYVAVDGSTIREGEGYRATAKINDQSVDDLTTHLYEGDVVSVTNGEDIMEPYTDSNEKSIKYKTTIEGSGPVHIYTSKGQNGTKVTRTGQESGKTAEVVTKEAKDTVMTKYHVDTKGDKVICLTFDDGPWPTTTDEILDILEENNAKATFFTIGQQIANHTNSIQRMINAGHQICTHTYDHAAGSGKGVNITYMSNKEQIQEIEKGYSCIKEVTNNDASTVVRLPGGNLNEKTADNIKDLITCEAGWSLDTMDWSKPGADHIYNVLMQAEGGSIILMHDGGGDRSQTVAGLKKALPKLAEKGYSFITMDEMLSKYPYDGEIDDSAKTSTSSDSTDTSSDSSSDGSTESADSTASGDTGDNESATKEDEQ